LAASLRDREKELLASKAARQEQWAATHPALPVLAERAQVEDHLVDNGNRPATVVAEEVLHRVGWLPSRAGGQ
jgi:hypothetical protein